MAKSSGIYRDLKILELGSGAAGPVATRYFAEHGATVIRIESAKRPDFLRTLHMTRENAGDPDVLERAPMFVLLNPGKQSVALNLKEPRATELVKRLVAWADVVSENFAPGVMERFGLSYAALQEVREDLVMVSGCLFGQTGPQRAYPGFGGQGSAIAGFNHLTGWEDREAHGPYATITDSLSPRYVAVAIAAALLERKRTGKGRYIDLSQIESGVYSLSETVVRFSANGEIETRRGNASELDVPHGVYPCSGEDRWIAIAVRSDAEWARLVEAMGEAGRAFDAALREREARLAAREEIDRVVADWTRAQERFALMDSLQRAGVEAGVVQDFEDLLHDPQLGHRKHFQKLEHGVLGELSFERSGFRLADQPGGFDRPGPLLGEHNEAVLGDILGLSADEIEALVADGVVV